MKKILMILALSIAVGGCGKYNEVTMHSIFKLTLASDVEMRDQTKAWVIVRDNGTSDLIDYKAIRPGESVGIETGKAISNGKIDVIYFTLGEASTLEISVFTAVDPGSEWNWKEPTYIGLPPPSSNDRAYFVDPSIFSSLYEPLISDQYGKLTDVSYDRIKVPIRSGVNRQLLSCMTETDTPPFAIVPKYSWIKNLGDQDEVTITDSDLLEFDKVVPFNHPGSLIHRVYVQGFDTLPAVGTRYFRYYGDSLSGFVITREFAYYETESIPLGFMKELPYYYLDLSSNGFAYKSFGPAPNTINYVDPSKFQVNHEPPPSFSFTTNHEYVYYITTFEFQGNRTVNLRFYGTADTPKYYQPLPDALLNEYFFPFENIPFVSAEFVTEDVSYADFLTRNKSASNGELYDFDAPYLRASVTVRKNE